MKKELKILMLEDIDEDAGLILRALMREDFQFIHERVDTREDFTKSLWSFKPDVILSDHSLPQFNSIEALRICKENGLYTPFILVTGAVSEEFAVMCLKQGADDYVLKSNLSRLPIAIRAALEHRYQECTRLEQQATLRKQNNDLIKVNKELDSFVYSVSHNLRSPLASVLGLVNVAKMETDKNKEIIARYFELIEKSVLKLDETLKEILDYSRNSRSELVIDTVDLEKLVQGVFAQLMYMKGHDGIQKDIAIQQQAGFYADNYRVGVILNNLISNAIKYRDESKANPSIRVKATVTPERAEIEVSDNGIGIHSEQLPHIYEMFFRATEKSEGSGLGLYIVKEMMDRLNGEIEITSKHGEGTTIRLSIPNRAVA